MMPDHYVEVNLKKVEFALTKDEIAENLIGTRTYRTTRFILLNNCNEWAVVKVRKRREPRLFPRIVGLDILSLPKDTVYCERKETDVHNRTLMARVAATYSDKAVIVKGRFEHVSFILNEPVLNIRVLDVVPPASRLMTLAEEVVRLATLKMAINFIPELINLKKLIVKIDTRNVMFPCRVSELVSSKRDYFLDEHPKLSEDDIEDLTLVGCRLSKNIFKSVYRNEPEFISMCPKDLAKGKELTLTRCCMYEKLCIEGKTAFVPWGATTQDVHLALRRLVNLAQS